MDGLDARLDAIEIARLGHLHLGQKAFAQVLDHNSVTGGKKGEHHLDHMPLLIRQLAQIRRVPAEVDLARGPDGLLRYLPMS